MYIDILPIHVFICQLYSFGSDIGNQFRGSGRNRFMLVSITVLLFITSKYDYLTTKHQARCQAVVGETQSGRLEPFLSVVQGERNNHPPTVSQQIGITLNAALL